MDASQKSDLDESGERASRRFRTLEEKPAILKEADEPGASVAAVARKHSMNANLLFGWRRSRQAGLLEKQRYSKSAPLLPVKITTPTLTPTRRMGKRIRDTRWRGIETSPLKYIRTVRTRRSDFDEYFPVAQYRQLASHRL
jgi:transposase